MHPHLRVLVVSILLCVAWASPAEATPTHAINVQIGSCKAQLRSPSPWTANGDGTYSNPQRHALLVPNGTSIQLPMLSTGPMRVDPRRLSFPLDARLLPLPRDGFFGELVGNGIPAGPVSGGIDTGANIRKISPNLFLNPRKSYFYFTMLNPFVLDLNKKNKTQPPNRAPKKPAGKKFKNGTLGFALDPCDPAVFFGGVSVNIKGITATLEGMGFSLNGNIQHRTNMPIWTGRTLSTGQPELRAEVLNGHAYLKGTIGVGIAKFVSLTGTAAVTMNLDPKRNGVWGLQEAIGMFKGVMPTTLPDFSMIIEGSQQVTLPVMSIPLAKVALSIDAANSRAVRVRFAGEQIRGAKLSELFSLKVPGADLVTARGKIQFFANATFDSTSTRPNGSYAIKARGVLEVATMKVSGDVDISYRSGGLPQVCLKLPATGRICGKEIENAAEKFGKAVAKTATDAANTVARSMPSTCPTGYSKSAVSCVKNTCPSGMTQFGANCVSICPRNSSHSATGAHCMTKTKKPSDKTTSVWVGNFKPKSAYQRACPSGTRYTHDLAGYSYCKSGGCPSGYPVRKGAVCHASCSPLSTDAFGNCPVKTRARETRPFGCPSGYRKSGPLCVR